MQTKYFCPAVTFDSIDLGPAEINEQISIERTEIEMDICDPDSGGLPIYVGNGRVKFTITATTQRIKEARQLLLLIKDGSPEVGELVLQLTGKRVDSNGVVNISSTTTYSAAELVGVNISGQQGQAATAQLSFVIPAGCAISHTFTPSN